MPNLFSKEKLLYNSILWIVIAILLLQMSNLIWQVVLANYSTSDSIVSTATTTQEQRHQRNIISTGIVTSDLIEFRAFDIFGKLQQKKLQIPKKPKPSISYNDPQKTKLKLKLIGLSFSNNPSKSQVIIEANNQQKVYKNGDNLPIANATIEKIEIGRVIILHRGKPEKLLLFKKNNTQPIKFIQRSNKQGNKQGNKQYNSPQNNIRKIDHRQDASISRQLSKYKKLAYSNPLQLIGAINAVPIKKNNVFEGFRLSAGNDKNLFQQSGLRNNDVLKSVNGVELYSQKEIYNLMPQLQSARELTITVERQLPGESSKTISFQYSLPSS